MAESLSPREAHVLDMVARLGQLGDPACDAAKAAQLVVVPATVLRRDAPNELRIDITVPSLARQSQKCHNIVFRSN